MRQNVSLPNWWKRGFLDPGADFLAARRKRVDIVAVEALQLLVDPPAQLVGGEEFAEGIRGGGEAAGHADAGGRQCGRHLAQRSVLAPDLREIRQPQIF